MNQEEEALLLIRLHLAQGQGKEALQAVVPWKEKAQSQGRQRSLLEILILEALAYVGTRQMSQARATFLHALRLAQPAHVGRTLRAGCRA